jgi:hypothetical protein
MRGAPPRRQVAGGSQTKAPITVAFGMQYGNELSPAESNPMVSCYFSSPVEGPVLDLRVPENEAGKALDVALQGELTIGTLLPADTKLVFYQTCERANEFGVQCRVPAGIGMVDLAFLMNGANREPVDISLKMPSAGNIEKGRVRLTPGGRRVAIGSGIRWEPIGVNAAVADRRQSPAEAAMITYINNLMHAEIAMPNTFEDTGNVRIPIYYGDFGMLKKDAPLPAAAYFMCKVPNSNRFFWTNALDVVLARQAQTTHDLERLPVQGQARVMADLNCYLIQGLDYMPDIVDTNKRSITPAAGFIGNNATGNGFAANLVAPGENFADALRTESEDCEGLGLGIGGQVFIAFLRADFEDHPLLKRLQEIGHQYMAVMTLDTVMGASVNDGKRHLGAHIKCNFLPAIWVKERMAKAARDLMPTTTKSRIASSARRPINSHIGNAVADQAQLPWKPFADYARKLEVLIAEGTGAYETADRVSDPLRETRAKVDQAMPSLHGMKKPLVHLRGEESSFFVGSMVGFTSYWFEQGANVGGMWLGYTERGSGTMKRGIEFKELVAKSDNISILAHPAFSDEVKAHIEHAVRVRVPPKDLVLTPEGVAAYPEKSPKLEEIAAFTRSLGRSVPSGAKAAPFYIREHQLTPDTIKAIKADIAKNNTIVGVGHVREPVTDWMAIYRTGFFVGGK